VLTASDADKGLENCDWEYKELSTRDEVIRYRHPVTKLVVVVKQARQNTDRTRSLGKEVEFYKLIKNENMTNPLILQFHKAEQDSRDLRLYLQSMEQGSIKDKIGQARGIGIEQIRRYTRSVASALAYLHDRQIIWNGCSADHVLLDLEGNPKISGFGSFRRKNKDGKTARLEPEEVHRRLRWLAPEAANASICSRRTDVWALGCFVVEMITCEDPHFECTTRTEVAQKMMRSGDPRPPTGKRDDESTPSESELLVFLDSVFVTKSSQRLTAKELLRQSQFLLLDSI
jgi:serine/threonine protein kinase